MVEKYHYYGMVWKFPTFVKYRGHRYQFGGTQDVGKIKENVKELKFSGKSSIIRVFTKKNRSGKKYVFHVLYWRDTGKHPKFKPFDWNDPENKRRYNLK
jgi:hypothetical protein